MTDDRAKADCPWCGLKNTTRRHHCIEDHDPSCDIRTTRDGWEAGCTCQPNRAKAEAREDPDLRRLDRARKALMAGGIAEWWLETPTGQMTVLSVAALLLSALKEVAGE